MSKGNIFISVMILLSLAPLCQAADHKRGRDLPTRQAKRARTEVPVEKVISLRGTASLKSMLAKAWIHRLKQQSKRGTLTPDQIEEIAPVLRPLIATEYYFLVDERLPQLPQCLRRYFEGVTLQDLREHGKVPAVKDCLGERLLNLKNKNLVDITGGFEKEKPQRLNLSRNRLTGLSKDPTLAELTYLDLSCNQLDEEAEKKIKSMFPNSKILFY